MMSEASTSDSDRSGGFSNSLLLICDHNLNFILMAALIALGYEFILLGEFWHKLLWTGNYGQAIPLSRSRKQAQISAAMNLCGLFTTASP